MKIAYNVEYLVIFSMPTSALGLPGHTKHWHGQSGHLPIKNYEGMGKAGNAKKGGREGKCGHGHALGVGYPGENTSVAALSSVGMNTEHFEH